jgi:hypothetical protein
MTPLPVSRPFTKVFRECIESVWQYGPLALAAYLFDLVRVHRAERTEGFDRRFGTDTATVVYPWNLENSSEHDHAPACAAVQRDAGSELLAARRFVVKPTI